MNKVLILVALLASCEGRCNQSDAAHDAVGPGAVCAADGRANSAVCIMGQRAYVCSMDGIAFHVASCTVVIDATKPEHP